MPIYLSIFTPSETVQEMKQQFLVSCSLKTSEFTDRGDNGSLCGEGMRRGAVALKTGFSQGLHSQRLGGRKDIKGFSQS